MLFGKKISFEECKNYILTNFRSLKYKVHINTPDCFCIRIEKETRYIDIYLRKSGKKVTVDVEDAFGIVRIPRETFNDIIKYREFMMNVELQLVKYKP